MTTAHRPTWKPAVGGSEQGGNKITVPTRQYSSKDIPGYTTLKKRIFDNPSQLQDHPVKKLKHSSPPTQQPHHHHGGGDNHNDSGGIDNHNHGGIDNHNHGGIDNHNHGGKSNHSHNTSNISSTSSHHHDHSNHSHSRESDDDDDDDDDDEILLMREFEKIKKERENMKVQKEQNDAELNEEKLKNNPLFDKNYSLQKRWFEDTVFKNQARIEKEQKQGYINDAVRSQFHRKFMGRYILN